jgi:hypothetical protein
MDPIPLGRDNFVVFPPNDSIKMAMGRSRHKEKLIFRPHHQNKTPQMHLPSLMPYEFGYRHIYSNALLPRAATYTYNLIHSACPYSRDPIPTFLGPYPHRKGVPRWPLSQV